MTVVDRTGLDLPDLPDRFGIRFGSVQFGIFLKYNSIYSLMHTYMSWNPKWIGVKWFEFQYASDIWIMNHRITYKMLNWIRIRQWTNNKRILHSLINEELRQIFDTGLEIFSTNVIFPVQFSGLVQILKFLCAYVIKMKHKGKGGKEPYH